MPDTQVKDDCQSPLRALFFSWQALKETYNNLPDDCDETTRDAISREIALHEQKASDFEPRTVEDLSWQVIFADDNGDMCRNVDQQALASRAYTIVGIDQASGRANDTLERETGDNGTKFWQAENFASISLNLSKTNLSDRCDLHETLRSISDILAAYVCQPRYSEDGGTSMTQAGSVVGNLTDCFDRLQDDICGSVKKHVPTNLGDWEKRSEFLLKSVVESGASALEIASLASELALQKQEFLRQRQA